MKYLFVLCLCMFTGHACAAWVNTTGKITSIVNYAHRDTILVALSDNGMAVSQCSDRTTFAVGDKYTPERRARMYAMLLAAQASERSITISYNDVGNCEPWDSNPDVFRLITRLTLKN
ncbi:hypothetical protein [Shewanella sp. 1180_01]|uniref:hypothetical protein n=1 Tax=Shewanella sp. 1180_01 TaxID=2604451 RepID=UPI004063C520